MWDCKYKIGRDYCRRRKTPCFPGGKFCVLEGKYEFPLRNQRDALEESKSSPNKIFLGKARKRKRRR